MDPDHRAQPAAGLQHLRRDQCRRAGVVAYPADDHLTAAGRDLWSVLSALGTWGERWLELGDEHTNPYLVLWAWCTVYLERERLPDYRVVVRFEFTDQPAQARHCWMLVEHRNAEVCRHHPRFEEDLVVETDGKTFTRWHLKHIEWAAALRNRRV